MVVQEREDGATQYLLGVGVLQEADHADLGADGSDELHGECGEPLGVGRGDGLVLLSLLFEDGEEGRLGLRVEAGVVRLAPRSTSPTKPDKAIASCSQF